ncbi:MAG: hypothetical protein AB1546_14460 [bacterium]
MEAGGPEPGSGCGGRGISLMLKLFEEYGVFDKNSYDVVLFDVLGDIVCGGFAGPLRKGFNSRIFIVISEEVMSLYAANNIAHAACTFAGNGVRLGGLIVNLRDNNASLEPLERFAEILNTNILAVILRDSLIMESEVEYMTVIEYAPESKPAGLMQNLADKIMSSADSAKGIPTPMTPDQFHQFIRTAFVPC